ncbi:MAG: hypothetical protein POELPBGB_02491 [Bacteroidia bacterium]|nr:hypothetical protein [Bacteroidia bacterium]
MKTKIASGILALISLTATAQNETDALRYSQTSPTGTARFAALGGAFGALGGDFTTLSFNPAGIAFYRSSELSFTPSIYNSTSTSDYIGTRTKDNKLNFNFGNLGAVFTRVRNKEGSTYGWLNFNFGIGYNRLNSFQNRVSIEGRNFEHSIADAFASQAYGTHYDDLQNTNPFDANLAWYTYIIDTASGATSVYNTPMGNYGQIQKLQATTRGSLGETVFSFGANYSNRLYLGATIGIPNVRYTHEKVYEEIDDLDTIQQFTSMKYTETLKTSGNGFNLKLGVIYRIADWVRIGAAFHTPTYLRLTDNWISSMNSTIYNQDFFAESPTGTFQYTLTTPLKAIGSVGFIIGKAGLISADYEYVNYSTAKLNSSSYNFSTENKNVNNNYHGTGNIRIGTEWRYKIFSARAGYSIFGSPYSKAFKIDNSTASIGAGLRTKGFFMDAAYLLNFSQKNRYNLYVLNETTAASSEVNNIAGSFMLTVGFRY